MPGLETFYRRHFSDKPRLSDMALWRWEFIEHPLITGDLPFFVIESGGEIHGAIGYMPLRIRMGERILPGGHPVNYFVLPQHKGLSALQLFKAVLSDCPVVLAGYFSGDSKRLLEKAGFINLSQHVRGYYLPLRFDPTLLRSKTQRFLSKQLYKLRAAWGGLLKLYYDRLGTAGVRHTIGTSLDKEFESFVTLPPEQTLSVYKDASYLHWRYARSPALNCVFIHQYRGNRPTALAVLHIDSAQHKAILLDIMAHPFHMSQSIQLLATAVGYCRKNRVSMLTTELLDGKLDTALRTYGFRSMPSEIGLIAYASDKDLLPLLADYRNWHFVIGDTDRY